MKKPAFKILLIGLLVAAALLASCIQPVDTRDILFEPRTSQFKTRAVQSREFEITDRINAMRAVICTLQDLDFVIERADPELGMIKANRMQDYTLSMTVMVIRHSNRKTRIRSNMIARIPGAESTRYGGSGADYSEDWDLRFLKMEDQAYQEFFASLEKNLSRARHWAPLPVAAAP